MSGDITRDPVFGEVARALQARGRDVPHRHRDGVPCEQTVRVEFRSAAFSQDELARLASEHAWSDPTAKDGSLGASRTSIARLAADSSVYAAFLAASDNAQREPGPIRIQGVVNVTPDSFSDGGRFLDPQRAIEHGLQLVAEGADLLDVGGESTRPGSEPISADEELCRIKPVIEGLARAAKVPISVDTTKSTVARAALDAGATIVNDISAGRHDPAILDVVAAHGAGYVAMHMRGEPRTMQQAPHYDDVVTEVTEFLRERCAVALEAGVDRAQLWIDPGIGFGKSLEHNLELLRHLPELRSLGLPILIGVSRKAFIGKITGSDSPAADRIGGTAAAVALAVVNGAEILRVHDVAIMREAALVARAIGRAR
jgi:dihydropteroate synthase